MPAFELLGSNLSTEWQPQSATGETFSYFIGRDPSKWIRDVPHYARLLRSGVYPGIDLVLYSNGNQLEYDFLLAPHADPAAIRLKLKGSPKVSIGQDGALIVTGPQGQFRHRKPILTETLPGGSRRDMAGGFRILAAGEVGFSVARDDANLPSSIDPVLETSAYFVGSADDQIVAIDGGAVMGNTTSIDLPGAIRPSSP